jgi:hypothetical protein
MRTSDLALIRTLPLFQGMAKQHFEHLTSAALFSGFRPMLC